MKSSPKISREARQALIRNAARIGAVNWDNINLPTAERHAVVLQYCHDLLNVFADLGDIGRYPSLLSARAETRRSIANILFEKREFMRTIAELDLAMEEAFKSNKCDLIGKVLHLRGMAYFAEGYNEEAIANFQRSLAFSRNTSPRQFMSTLEYLAMLWGRNISTLELALGMYDWIICVDYYNIEAYFGKARTLKRHHQYERMKEIISNTPIVDCQSAILRVALHSWLGEQVEAVECANAGLNFAMEINDLTWTDFFRNFEPMDLDR